MADDAGQPPPPVSVSADAGLDFFQLLRRLEQEHRDRPRLGRAQHSLEEAVRLGQEPALAFLGNAPVTVREGAQGEPTRVSVGFFGVFGPNGPLPLHITEYAHQRARNARDPTFARFVDLFHHRLLVFFYRAWADARPVVSHDRPEDDHFARYVGALSGQGAEHAADDALRAFALSMAGLLSARSRHAEGLTQLLTQYFRVPVALEEFVGEWLETPDAYQWRLGQGGPLDGLGRLGLGTHLGRRTFARQSKFRIVLGPLARADHARFMPGGDFVPALVSLVHRYVGPDLSWDVRLVLAVPARAPTRLDGRAALGRTTHLVRDAADGERPFQDYVYTPLDHASTRGAHG